MILRTIAEAGSVESDHSYVISLWGLAMAISENTRGNEQRRLEELFQTMQNSWGEFQQSVRAQMLEQQERQEHVNSTLKELITGLSRQVLQLATAAESSGSNFESGNSTFSRLSRIEFPHFDGEDV